MAGYRAAPAALLAAMAVVLLLAACGSGRSDRDTEAGTEETLGRPTTQDRTVTSLCLTCHSRPGIEAGAPGADRLLDFVAPFGYYASAHAELPCTECHRDQEALPHQRFDENGRPLVRPDAAEVCRECHESVADEFQDSLHGTVSTLGDERAPGCVDCHSTHYVRAIDSWGASARAAACGKCHEGADPAFAGALTHREPTPNRLAIDYYAIRFFGALLVAVIGVGILHVELDLLRWLRDRLGGRSRREK